MDHQPTPLTPLPPPPPRRINVRGTSGTGKTTFAAELAKRLDLPHIELDSLHWGPNWSESKPEDFRAAVCEVIDANPQGWVIDGNYDSKLQDTVLGTADTIVWLDPPLPVVCIRLLRRTLFRIWTKVELWHGNRETWRNQLAVRNNLFLWTLRAHGRYRRLWPERFGHDPRLVRLQSNAEIRRWLDALPRES